MSLLLPAASETALEVVLAPSSIPPAPESGVVLCGITASRASPASTAAIPCAEFWPGAAAAETLRPSQVLTVAADELDWLYENTDDETDPACIQARAAIEGWLAELSPEHGLVIALQHDATAWPEQLPACEEEDSYALVLHGVWPSGLETITGKRGVSIALGAIVGSNERRYAFPSVGEMRGSSDNGWGGVGRVQRITRSPCRV